MALIKSGTVGTSAPLLAYELHAEQTGASGTSRTVKITAKFKVNGSSNWWYGYACNWRARVHNSYGGWSAIKGTESWNGGQAYRSFSQTLTVDVGTTSSTSIVVGLYTDSQVDNGWDGNATGSFTVGSTNVAPTISGTVSTSPSGVVAENTSSITVTAPTASDANGNLSGYRCRVSINGGGYTEIYRGSSRSFKHNVSGYGEGTTFQYCFDCYDSAGAWSGNVYSGVVTKNRFTGDTLNSSSSITYSDGNNTISFTYSGASNTNGNTTIKRILSCSGITVYNSTLSGTSSTVTIYRSGTAPTTPYIKFDDIKNKFAGASYKGALTFTLTTSNAYGTTRTSSKVINVNLQTAPKAVGSCSIATDANSTAYKTVASTKNKYFLPDGSNVIRVNWSAGSGKLGEAVSYELYVAYGSGSWSKVASIASGTLYYNHKVPKQTVSQSIKYKVRTITGYGTYADRDTSAQTLHFYNVPSLTTGTITRGATTADVQVTIKSNSSIPNINTVGTWNCYVKDTTTSVASGNLTVSQAVQVVKVTGLTDAGQYDLKVTFKDDTGFSSNDTKTVPIGANSPLFFVNKYGVGVNGVKATSAVSLNVKGSIGITDGTFTGAGGIFTYKGNDVNGMGMAIQSGGTMVIGGGESPRAYIETIANKSLEELHLTSDGGINFITNCQTMANKITVTLSQNGTFNAPNVQVGGQNVYHTGRKPTPADIGASASNHGHSNYVSGTGAHATTKAGDAKYIWKSGFYDVDVDAGGKNAPFSNWNWLIHAGHSNNSGSIRYGMQIAGQNGSNNFAMRTVNQNGDGTWNTLYHTNKKPYDYGNDGANRHWIRFHDGTQICWGKHVHSAGDINMQTNIANNTVYGGVNINLYYPVTFTTTPSVQISVSTNAYTCCQATGIATNLFTARAWGNYASVPNHLYFFWIAIGRWK